MGMYPSLMGTFSYPAPVLMIGSSFSGASSLLKSVSFHTTHMEDTWTLSSPSLSNGPIEIDVSFPTTMISYQVNIDCVAEPSPSSSRIVIADFTTPSESHLYGLPLSLCRLKPLGPFFVL